MDVTRNTIIGGGAVLAAIVLAVVAWRDSAREGSATHGNERTHAANASVLSERAQLERSERADGATQRGVPDPATPARAPEAQVLVSGRVLDVLGAPRAVDTIELEFAALSAGAGTVRVRNGPDGYVATLSAGGHVLIVTDPFGRDIFPFDVPEGVATWTRDITVSAQRELVVRAHTPRGESLARRVLADPLFSGTFPFDIVVTREPLVIGARFATRLVDTKPVSSRFRSDHAGADAGRDEIGTLTYTLARRVDVHANALCRDQVVASQPLALDAGEVVFELEPAALVAALPGLRVRVRDAVTRAFVIDAHVRVIERAEPVASATTDAGGTCTLRALPAGRRWLVVDDAEHALWQREVEFAPGRENALDDVLLTRPAELSVRVVDPSGRSVAYMFEIVELATDGSTPAPQLVTAFAGSPVRVTRLSATRHVLRSRVLPLVDEAFGVSAPERVPAASDDTAELGPEDAHAGFVVRPVVVDLSRGVPHDVVLALEPAHTCVFRLAFEDARDLRVQVSRGDGALVLDERVERDRALVRLAADTYTVRVTSGARVLAERTFTVSEPLSSISLP